MYFDGIPGWLLNAKNLSRLDQNGDIKTSHSSTNHENDA